MDDIRTYAQPPIVKAIMSSRSEELATLGFLPLRTSCTESTAATRGVFFVFLLLANSHDDGFVKDLLNADAFLGTALHVHSTHLGGDGATLFRCHWSKALRLQQINACLLMAEVRLQAAQDDRRRRAKMEHFRIPLVKFD